MSWPRKFSDSLPKITPGEIRGVIHDSLEFEQIRDFIITTYPYIDQKIILGEDIKDQYDLMNKIFPILNAKKPHNPLFALAKLDEYIGSDKNSQAFLKYKAALIQYCISEEQLAIVKAYYGKQKRVRRSLIIGASILSGLAFLLLSFRFFHRTQINHINNVNRNDEADAQIEQPALPRMVRVPSGTFMMGSATTEFGRDNDETQHEETIPSPFEISETEITQAQYKYIMKRDSPSKPIKPPDYPVDSIRWYDAAHFCNAFSKMQGLEECYHIYLIGAEKKVEWQNYNCNGYRLPTEAEWEYAARAGTSNLFAGSDNLDAVGWNNDNSGAHSHAVRSKSPNKWGIYDMSGNLAEWIWDGYSPDYHGGKDRAFAGIESKKIIRGGFFKDEAKTCRVANRSRIGPGNPAEGMGIRIVRTLNASK